MNKYILCVLAVLALVACSSNPKRDNHKINCDKMHLDSQSKLDELQLIFNAYQGINVDLATKISGPYRDEVAQLHDRIRKQKARCWKEEDREIDSGIASLLDDVKKIYGESHFKAMNRKTRNVASVVKAESPSQEEHKKSVGIDIQSEYPFDE